MDKDFLWTKSGARLTLHRRTSEKDLHWIFLPGGPGLGSESLLSLLQILNLPGSMWRLDLPGDGSNTTPNNKEAFSHWPSALMESVSQFKHVVLVAHSTGGMYALSLPKLEKLLDGLILLNSAPNAKWQASFSDEQKKHPILELAALHEKYRKHPNNETLKTLTIASAPYLFTKKGLASGIEMLKHLSYNYESCQWSEDHFDQIYEAQWIPKEIPTLILSGRNDLICPLKLFKEDPRFHLKNIDLVSIESGGHFPWIENPSDVALAFEKYCAKIER